ncbi:MAG: glyoxylate/hydroxypyruvate reductase A [Cyclobacteriaceae bacterium]
MALVIVNPKGIEPWINALKQVDPTLDIRAFPNDSNREEVSFALTWRHPHGIFKDYVNLKCISSMGAGVDHLLKDPDLPKGAAITRLVDPYLAQDMAEFVLALIMNHLRDLNAFKIKQTQAIWKPSGYLRIRDVKVGIMGLGAIGKTVATELQKNGFRVIGWTRTPREEPGIPVFAGNNDLPKFLNASDILVCILPLTKETQGILNRDNLRQLPKNAFVINVGRGEQIVDEDLVQLISDGHLSGASLDVFSEEPLPSKSLLWSHPRVNITPHIASLTNPESVAPQIVENYYRMKKGEPLLNVVSKEKGY